MIRPARRSDALRSHHRWRVPDGVSLVELLCAVVVVAVVSTAGYTGATSWSRAQRAARVASLLQWEVTVARSYAVRSGRSMSLVVNEITRTVILRDGSNAWRKLALGTGAPMEVERLSLDLPGDSLVFTPRGLCSNCGTGAPVDFAVSAQGRHAMIRVGMFRTLQPAPPVPAAD